MNLAELTRKGAVVDACLTPKDIEWTHTHPDSGEEVTDKFTVYVRRLSFGDAERLLGGAVDGRSRNAAYLSAAVRLGEAGDEVIPYEVAYNMDGALGFALLAAVNEVNGTGRNKPKN